MTLSQQVYCKRGGLRLVLGSSRQSPSRASGTVRVVGSGTYSAKGDGNDIADGSQGNGDDGGNLHFDCCGVGFGGSGWILK